MEGKCQQTASDVFYIYNLSKVLGQVWNGIDSERRQESIDKLRGRVADLNDRSAIRRQDANRMFDVLDRTALQNNKPALGYHRTGYITEGHILSQLRGFLADNALELAIHAIADCECMKPLPEGDK